MSRQNGSGSVTVEKRAKVIFTVDGTDIAEVESGARRVDGLPAITPSRYGPIGYVAAAHLAACIITWLRDELTIEDDWLEDAVRELLTVKPLAASTE